MTDLNRLVISLTKQGTHKTLPVLLARPASNVVAAIKTLPKGQKVDAGHIRNILSTQPNDILPEVWQVAKAHSEEALRHFWLWLLSLATMIRLVLFQWMPAQAVRA